MNDTLPHQTLTLVTTPSVACAVGWATCLCSPWCQRRDADSGLWGSTLPSASFAALPLGTGSAEFPDTCTWSVPASLGERGILEPLWWCGSCLASSPFAPGLLLVEAGLVADVGSAGLGIVMTATGGRKASRRSGRSKFNDQSHHS